MAPNGIPPSALAKIKPAADATGLPPEEIWARQSKATHMAAIGSVWRAFWAALTNKKRAALQNNWKFWGRPAQQIVTGFFIWLILAGRGWGKTRTGAQFTIEMARTRPKSRGMLIGATAADVRDVMINGDSGVLACSPPDFMPLWEPSKLRLTWPNGTVAICRTADSPDRVRGPNLDWAWCDEFAAWRYCQSAWDMLMMCLRKGVNPMVCVTTTPRAIPLVKQFIEESKDPRNGVKVTRGSSWDNYWCLSAEWFRQIISRATGALSRQEIYAEVLDKVEGALWSIESLDRGRITKPDHVDAIKDTLCRVVIGVDPAEHDGRDNDECGIVAMGRTEAGHCYVLEDASTKGSPQHWARRVYETFLRQDADAIIAEVNAGGDMVTHTINSVIREGERRPRIIQVRAKKGKRTRAEPMAAATEEGRLHMLGTFSRLEDEMTTYVPGTSVSPNRMDSAVWAFHELFPQRYVNNQANAQ
jgi:phage terminase large subunit-like protein